MKDLSENLRPPGHPDAVYTCPWCFKEFNEREEKSQHLEKAHGYETLDVN